MKREWNIGLLIAAIASYVCSIALACYDSTVIRLATVIDWPPRLEARLSLALDEIRRALDTARQPLAVFKAFMDRARAHQLFTGDGFTLDGRSIA